MPRFQWTKQKVNQTSFRINLLKHSAALVPLPVPLRAVTCYSVCVFRLQVIVTHIWFVSYMWHRSVSIFKCKNLTKIWAICCPVSCWAEWFGAVWPQWCSVTSLWTCGNSCNDPPSFSANSRSMCGAAGLNNLNIFYYDPQLKFFTPPGSKYYITHELQRLLYGEDLVQVQSQVFWKHIQLRSPVILKQVKVKSQVNHSKSKSDLLSFKTRPSHAWSFSKINLSSGSSRFKTSHLSQVKD